MQLKNPICGRCRLAYQHVHGSGYAVSWLSLLRNPDDALGFQFAQAFSRFDAARVLDVVDEALRTNELLFH